MQQAEKRNLFFGDVQYVVLDEADTMFDKGFGPEVRAVLKPVRSKENPAQCTLVLATLTSVRPPFKNGIAGCDTCRFDSQQNPIPDSPWSR